MNVQDGKMGNETCSSEVANSEPFKKRLNSNKKSKKRTKNNNVTVKKEANVCNACLDKSKTCSRKSTGKKLDCKNCSYCSLHDGLVKEDAAIKVRIMCQRCKDTGSRRSFTSEETLARHIREDHDEPKPKFNCNGCHEIYNSKMAFRNHMMSQHHCQVFICEVCHDYFKIKANYKAHILTHDVPPRKAFKCDICNGTFVNRAGFEGHKRRFPGFHVKHTCDGCGVSFSKESHIKNHRCKKMLLKEAAERTTEDMPVEDMKLESEEQERQVYRPVSVSVSEPLLLDSEHLVIRELAGQIVTGTQVLQLDMSDPDQPPQVYQLNVADWNMVAPFVIRDPNLTAVHQASSTE